MLCIRLMLGGVELAWWYDTQRVSRLLTCEE